MNKQAVLRNQQSVRGEQSVDRTSGRRIPKSLSDRSSDRAERALLGRSAIGVVLLFAVSCQTAPEPVVSIEPNASCCAPAVEGGLAETAAARSGSKPGTILPATLTSPADEAQLQVRKKPPYARAFHAYRVPDLSLIDQNGERVSLLSELERSEPIALNFVFTTCTTICPVMTVTFSQLSRELGEDDPLRLVTISLDPEYDSPAILRGFSRRYGAGERWKFLTGDVRTLNQTYRAFNAVTGSKFNHKPFTLFKVPGDDRWLRIDGMASVTDLATEYRSLAESSRSATAGG